MSIFLKNLHEHSELFESLHLLEESLVIVGDLIANALAKGGRILFCGNGGSAADCQHLAAELTGRFIKDRRPLAAIALTTDSSVLTCIGNDYSFDEIFARQVAGLGREGDVLICISTSGNSQNLIRAVEEAQKMGLCSIGLLGRDGGLLRNFCSHSIVVPNQVTARIQEAHIFIGHTLCGLIEEQLGFS